MKSSKFTSTPLFPRQALVALLLYIDNSPLKSSMLSTVLQKGAIYALLVVILIIFVL